MDEYFTVIDKPKAAEIKIKGSKFIAHIFNVENPDQAQSKYSKICEEYHDARHNCFAYRITDTEYRYSDDGEPAGTAGKPIFQIIIGKDLYYILIVVTRYFGGTKLGIGGLSRAYSCVAQKALSSIKIINTRRYTSTTIQIRYDQLNEIMNIINKFEGEIDKSDYAEQVTINLKIPRIKFSDFRREIDHIIK